MRMPIRCSLRFRINWALGSLAQRFRPSTWSSITLRNLQEISLLHEKSAVGGTSFLHCHAIRRVIGPRDGLTAALPNIGKHFGVSGDESRIGTPRLGLLRGRPGNECPRYAPWPRRYEVSGR